MMARAKVTDELSPEAWALMVDGFTRARPAQAIADAVLEATGEQVSARTVARRAAEWRLEKARRAAARERMEDLVAALRDGNTQASEMIQALAMEALQNDPDALTSADPVKLHGLSLKSEELRLKRLQVELRARSIAVSEKKLAMLEDRERQAREALKDDTEMLTPDERVRRIKEIYGLA